MSKYKALLMSPDGDWVIDYRNSNSIKEVEEYLANQGSRWYFYPFEFIIRDNGKGYTTDKQRVVSAASPFENLKGKTIKTVSQYIATHDWS